MVRLAAQIVGSNIAVDAWLTLSRLQVHLSQPQVDIATTGALAKPEDVALAFLRDNSIKDAASQEMKHASHFGPNDAHSTFQPKLDVLAEELRRLPWKNTSRNISGSSHSVGWKERYVKLGRVL
jgi:hypothetical protein